MNTTHKIKPVGYSHFRREEDRARTINLTIQQVERENSHRMRRMQMVLGAAALLLVLNTTLIVTLS
jgi:hypothetical protein